MIGSRLICRDLYGVNWGVWRAVATYIGVVLLAEGS